MTKKFTKLMAAFALLVFMMPSLVAWGQTREEVTLWSEDFSSYSANDVPEGGTYNYSCTNGDGTTKIYNENTAGGTAPELLVGKNNGTFTAVIPLNNIEGTLTLTYYQNKQKLSVSSTTNGVSGGQDIKPTEVGQQTTTFTGITTSMTSITIVFKATTNNNVRLDNIVLTGTQAGGSTPAPSVTVTPSTISAPFTGAEGTLALAYENIEDFISFDYYFCDANGGELEGNDPDWIYAEINEENDTYTLSYIIDANDGAARTAYMKVYTFDDNEEEVYAIVTVNQAQYVADYATLPFEWAGGASADFLALNGVTAQGLGSDYAAGNAPYLIKFDGTGDFIQVKTNEQPGKVTINVKMIGGGNTSTITVQGSADGETFTDVEELTISGAQNSILELETTNAFAANVRYVRMLFTKGSNVGVGAISIALPSNAPFITVNPALVEAPATAEEEIIEGTLALAYENLTITDMTDFDIQYYDAEGEETTEPDWIEVLVAGQDPQVGEGYVVSYIMYENEGAARTAYFKVYAMDDETNLVYSNMVTVTQAAYVAPFVPATYTLATSIESGKSYIIVNNENSKAMGVQNNNNRAAVDVVIANEKITVSSDDVYEFVIESAGENVYSIYDARTGGYLYAASSSSNYLRTEPELDANGNGNWAISFDEYDVASIVAQGTNSHNLMQYNSGSSLFSCYGYDSQSPVHLYVKDETPAGNTITVDGYVNTDGGYVLLAWPESTSPADIDGMISDDWGTNVTPETSTYDLYSYDGSQEMEWRNYRKSNFNLVPGKGYLYASKAGVTLTYEGEANPEFDDVELSYVADNKIQSLYLAGNSKTTAETFYVYDANNKIAFNYLVMNEDGNGFTSGQADFFEAQPLQGFFVQAPGASTTLSTNNDLSKAGGVSLLNVQVMRNRGTVVDNAIVSFSNGPTMKKFQLFENSTKLYIQQDNEDYAIVRSEGQGELPVSFRAAENGTYTLSMKVENIDMNYLHLIDNMTGMDIDLLQTPSYTFEANTNDYVNRFKLVFAANGTDEADEASFAFFSDGNLIVNNEGNATLQVIDVNGRILSSETISGSCSKAINATTGVYMLRLINGDNVKVQKVVVR